MTSSIESLSKIINIDKLLNMIEQSYAFLRLDNNTQKQLNEQAANKCLNQSNINISKAKFFFMEEYNKHIRNLLINEANYILIEKYLNANSNNNFVSSLSEFFQLISGTFDIDMALYLLNDKSYYNYIKEIFEKNQKIIFEQGIEIISKNEILITLIEAYCNKNNIDLNDIESINIESLVDTGKRKKKSSNGDNYDENALMQYYKMLPDRLLTREEEFELAQKIRQGDKKAKDLFITYNLKLVIPIAKRYTNDKIPVLDLIQEGNIGLTKAAEKFNPEKHCKFSTYATWWIKESIIRYIYSTKDDIRIPVYKKVEINRLNRCIEQLEIKLGRYPSLEEIASEMKITVEKVNDLLEASYDVISYDAPIGSNETTLQEILEIPNELSIEDEIRSNFVNSGLIKIMKEELSQREYTIVCYRYGFENHTPMSLQVVGKMVGLSHERVRQIERVALRKLRKALKTIGLEDDKEPDEFDDILIVNTDNNKYTASKKEQEILNLLRGISSNEENLLEEKLEKKLYTILIRKFGKEYQGVTKLSSNDEKICKYKLYSFLEKLLRDYKGYFYYEQIFDSNNKALMLKAFYSLTLIQQKILLQAYGDILEDHVSDNISKDKAKALKKIVDKLKTYTTKDLMDLNECLEMFNNNYNLYNLSNCYNELFRVIYEGHDYIDFNDTNYSVYEKLEEALISIIKVILNKQEFEVISLLYGLEKNTKLSIENISKLLNKSENNINEIHNSAILKLRISPHLRKIFTKLNKNTIKNIDTIESNEITKNNDIVNLYSFFNEEEVKYLEFAVRKLTADELLFIHDIFKEGLNTEVLFSSLSAEDQNYLNNLVVKLKSIINNNKDINYRKVFSLCCHIYDNYIFETVCINLTDEERNLIGLVINCVKQNVNPIDYLLNNYNYNKRELLQTLKNILEKILTQLSNLKNQNNLVRKLMKENNIKAGSKNE